MELLIINLSCKQILTVWLFADVDVKIDRKTQDIVEEKAEIVTTYHVKGIGA